ncbi:MAG: hypothetical protein ACO3A2_08425 [Bdellovibrionia bacterium]
MLAKTASSPVLSPARTEARLIATRTLRSNIVSLPSSKADLPSPEQYLLAGQNQYHTLWARDLSMATAGALEIGETFSIKNSLEIFFLLQREDGLLPRVVDYYDIYRRVISGLFGYRLGYRKPLKGWFTTENRVISIDGNLTLPWAASQYIKKTHDLESAERWLPHLEKSIHFIETHFLVDGLVGKQPPFSDWKDSIRREGRVAFTNALYILALKGLAQVTHQLHRLEKAASFLTRAQEVESRFQSFFWETQQKRLKNFEADPHLSADANLFAIASGLLPKDQAQEALTHLKASPLWHPLPGAPTWPSYPNHYKSFLVRLIGLGGYHDRLYWMWISALAARAEKAMGHEREYQEIMNRLAQRIAQDQGIYEVYELEPGTSNLRPHRGWIYKSDKSFTWSAACYLEADYLS